MTTIDWTSQASGTGQYADVNGINLYYEIHGAGRPLVLLHGGLGSGEMMGPALPALTAAGHQVILPDLQGHGRTADIDRPIDVQLMADDIARADHAPRARKAGRRRLLARWRRLVLHGGQAPGPGPQDGDGLDATCRRSAIYPEMLAQQGLGPEAAEFMKDTPMYKLYHRVAPRPEDFGQLLGKMGASMAKDFDFSDAVRELTVPTLFACADADMFPPSHAVEVFGLLGGGQRDGGWMGEGRPAGGHALAIVPGATHYDVFASPVLTAAILAFLDAPED